MEVLCEKPVLPKIVVLSEASIGASAGASVIGKLVGLNLPCGLGITVVLKFRTESAFRDRKIWFEFLLENIHCEKEVSEARLVDEISELVAPVPEEKRSSVEVVLTVIQPQVSDLTVILLPEIHTYDPDQKDKSKREMELFEGYIDRYTRLNECLFLNIVSCSNFKSCLSSQLLKGLYFNGIHSITVFTKVDLSQLTYKMIETPTPFGFFFLDNDEITQECGFQSTFYKDYVGLDVISKNIVMAMWSILFSPSSLILERIESDMEASNVKIQRFQRTFDSVSEATPMILLIIFYARSSLYDMFIEQDYGGYVKDKFMHTTSNMEFQFTRFRIDLQDLKLDYETPFLSYEIDLLVSRNWPRSVNSNSIFRQLLDRQFSYASSTINNFVSCIMDYINGVVVKVLLDHGKNNVQLHPILRMFGGVWVEGVQNSFEKKLAEVLDFEKTFLHTWSDDFSRKLNEMKSMKLELDDRNEFTTIEGLGKNIRVDHLNSYTVNQIETAFELKKRMLVYWEFVVNRVVNHCPLILWSSIKEMMTHGMEGLLRQHVMTGIENNSELLDLPPIVALNKDNLERRVTFLKQAKKDIKKWQVEFMFLYNYRI
ncbi:hypothetical protein E3N88_34723 [Mikania micrantha]|uniref:GED domain-containing protein n=1 Tax=Mikania micrantha TaxID=192012 RepID=A0A5N6M1L2_9ASTR|nr:hypothetical protein E3N88_34723 [Mikania micrantha]